jgi:hypothetical protein
MYHWENKEDRVSIHQMNEQLRHAQLELISAHCATHQLRLRYSNEDLARFGQRDVLRKSAQAATALSEYYSAIQQQIPAHDEPPTAAPQVTEEQIQQGIKWVSEYLQQQREHYAKLAAPLPTRLKAILWPYFAPALLDQIRIVELKGARVPTPPFYPQVKAMGFDSLPQVTHMDSVTFVDVVVFNENCTERSLFHALVHAVQFQVLGFERYAELFVRSFVNTKFHVSVPLEAHAFSLESKFLRPASAERFSVEDQVRLWMDQGRY